MTHVLLVEDKEANLYLLEALFTGNGFTVDRAHHGAEALVLARRRIPDICVSDLLMPVMDGYTLLRQWKLDERLQKIPFVVYTATYTEPADERLAVDLGADAFILKPAEPDALMERIREVLDREKTSAPRLGVGVPDEGLLEHYSQTLIRKLEEKTLQLEATNAALELDIEERERAERERNVLVHQLNERVKELRAVHRVSELLRDDRGDIPKLLHAVAAILPSAMQYADVAAARLAFDGFDAASPNFRETEWMLRGDFATSTGTEGALVIAYLEARPSADEGPFLKEERALVDSLAGMLRAHFERAAAMRQLRQSAARLKEQAELLDKAQDAIIVRELDHTVRYWNKSAERLYGWTSEEAVGRTAGELQYPTDTSEFDRANSAVLARGEWVGEIHQRTKDGRTIIVEGHWTLVRDDQGEPSAVLAINTDISSRKAIEQQFLRSQRMESIGTLAGGIAHDLNNVLAPITMGLDLLRETVRDAESLETLELMASSAARGADMVRQVLTFARGVEGRRRLVDIHDPVRDVVTITRETFPKNITIGADVASDIWRVDADATQLHQVLLNLCVNSRDAMPHGGRLTIAASNVTLDQQYAAMNVEAHVGPYVRIEVEDSGLGIPTDIIDRIFDPFFTTKEVGKGTGLGLATTVAIVKAHHGFVRVYSEPGTGTRFRFYLPARTGDAAADPVLARDVGPRGAGETILVVDDEAAIRHVTANTLTAYGYRVLVASDGSEAVSSFLRHQAEIKLVITDMMMPVMDGRATIEVLRRIAPDVRIIGASGLAAAGKGGTTGAAPTEHFLTKPFTAATLLRMVRQVLEA